MTPDQVKLLRRLALNEQSAVNAVMSSELGDVDTLDPRTAVLVRIAALLSVDADPATFQWAVELGIAAGVDDGDVYRTLVVVAPIIGMARLTSSLPHLLAAFDLDIIED
jgi:4-carboxymuconolactone decarboxylase